jgi:phospholipid-translocating ATPase
LKIACDMEESKSDPGLDRKELENLNRLKRLVYSLAVCHNVTPVIDDVTGERTYQAASPDEVALVKFCESVNLTLIERTENKIVLNTPSGNLDEFEVLDIFPFTSETKRMGIILKRKGYADILFYIKGAESALRTMVESNDWLDEEVEGLAREGLRTLVFASRKLSDNQYAEFKRKYQVANSVLHDRQAQIRSVIDSIEHDLELLGVSGVEDKLQENVKTCLESLRNAGVKIWMLTGDKDETAKCIARSARLVDRTQEIFSISVRNRRDAQLKLDQFGAKIGCALVIDGPSLQICMEHHERHFVELACEAPAVICCRCSPTQKAEVVELLKSFTGKRCAAIGDGGNDVSMIQAAHVGVGIVGKEGRQASLAADFSVNQFSYVERLLLWHGRNAYKRTARLSQFIMHRGMIISIIQAVFSALFFYAAIPIYTGWLTVGYATIFTFLPVFSLVLDEDVSEELVNYYPELYQELQKGRPLSYKTFFMWIFQSVYQGGVIMIASIYLFQERFVNIVSITFTALILSQYVNVAIEIQKWHYLMVISEVGSLLCYLLSMVLLTSYFGNRYPHFPTRTHNVFSEQIWLIY